MTLPWLVPDGKPATFTLLVARPGSLAMHRSRFNESHGQPARVKAGVVPARQAGARTAATRDQGMHVLRHTAASAWLAGGADIVAVTAWLGDTVATVWATYAHLMPDADDRGRKAMDAFLSPPSAPDVPSEGSL